MGFFDNERYLISALVQSLAATIALVITLSLVAVQLAAQSYSTRVIDVYKKNPDMWILLCIYIAVIFYGLGLLKVIDIGVAGINMEFAIFWVYFLGFFAFICLVPYILKTLDLLKPSTVINLLAEEITKENVLAALKNHEVVAEIDPIQPIIDIINSALEKNEYETVRNVLKAITNSTVSILEESHFEWGEEDEFSRYIVDSIKNIAISAIQKENTNSTLAAIKNLEIIGTKAVENNHEKTAGWTAKVLEKIGINVAETQLEEAVRRTVKALEKMGYEAVCKKLTRSIWSATTALEKIGDKAVENKLRKTVSEIAYSLQNIGTKATENKFEEAIWRTTITLENLGKGIIESELDGIYLVVEAIEIIGTKAAKNRFEIGTLHSKQMLNSLLEKSKEKGRTEISNTIEESIQSIDKIP
ncbi:putative membrane protein (DUF2254) [Methanomethylovorans hollandica DSM 15978]|uniref:Putative membrane protein (DUF2254) n=1 Tax=Methanomethylovorans hollandica (strain DSM 15978 / NBRC 107637 / DMS1) TaxID=867904 RepID=L0KTB5_METHD|nr:DUF2254 family protein [Methanomethylovorans hollandica]AGB48346.1 putative membrane protein (DUF2254) [Methanomethylovorans hollandica DSM 15978]